MKKNNKSGFTLLEIIIVIIIVGVLASLALPRFFSTVEFSKSTEALNMMAAIRQSMERCYVGAQGDYTGCSISSLDIEDPANSPGAHFAYAISGASATGYTLTATRNSFEGGNSTDFVRIVVTSSAVTRSGSGAFSSIQ